MVQSSTPRRRVVKPAEQRRREILDAALRLFKEKGFDETTVQDVAAAAEVATGSVYLHFASKQDLLVALSASFFDGLTGCVADTVEDLMTRTAQGETIGAREALDSVVDATATYAVSSGDLCGVAAQYLPHHQMVGAELEFVDFLTRVFEQGAEAGLLDDRDPEMAAYLTNAAISGTLFTAIAYGRPADLDRLLAATKSFLFRALRPGG